MLCGVTILGGLCVLVAKKKQQEDGIIFLELLPDYFL